MKYGEATMGQFEAVINKLGGMEGLQKFLSGELVLKTVSLLQQVATQALKAFEKFSAKDTFGAKKPAVKFYFQSDDFKRLFLTKVEDGVGEATLAAHKLTKDSLDAPILAELGDRAETSLAHFWTLLSQQPNGEDGILLTNAWANIFYIRGIDGNLWAVSARWYAADGWGVFVSSVESPYRWYAGYQVFSR